MAKIIRLKEHKRGVGRQCTHCGRGASWSGIYTGRTRIATHMCVWHKKWIVDLGQTVVPDGDVKDAVIEFGEAS